MLALILGLLLLSTPTTTVPAQAETFAAAGEAHLRRASDGRSRSEFEAAHKNFDSAYLVADEARYLCRALTVAEQALRVVNFSSEQERLSWEDLRRDDLDRLRDDAEQAQRSNCRFDASGKPLPPRVALIDPDGPVCTATWMPPAGESTTARPHAPVLAASMSVREQTRRFRAHTAAGAVFTAVGVGLFGGFGGVLELQRQRAMEVKGLITAAKSEERYYTPAEAQRFGELAPALVHGRNTAIGIGVAALATLTTGIVVLATRKRKTKHHRFALHPYGDRQGGGALLRLRF